MSSEPGSLEGAFHRAAGEQGGFFGMDWDADRIDAMRDRHGNLPKNVFRMVRQQQAEERRKPGRPKGAGSKRNQALAKLVMEKFGDPVQAMASLYAMPLDQLVEMIHIADPGKDGKAGDIAIKALNVQLAAAKATAEYVHSKKPVEATVTLKSDGVLVFPGGVAGSFDQLDEASRATAALIEGAVSSGQISADELAGMRLVDGQLVDAEWHDLDDDESGAA
jgi:hypothetical protein